MNLHICPNCNTKLKPNKFKSHFRKIHPELSLEDIDLLLIPEYLLTSSIGWNIPIRKKDAVLLLEEKIRIYNKFSSFEIRFNSFRNTLFFEAIELGYEKLKQDVTDFAVISDEEMDLPVDVMIEIILYKSKRTRELLERLETFKSQILLKHQQAKAQYQTIFVTWSDLTFDKNKIRISANKAFVKAIDLPTEIRSFKSLKVEFFRKNYSNAKYKLVIYRGVIMPELSRGLKEILDLVSKHSSVISRNKRDLIYSEITCKYQRIV
jgi:hypothetical protein